MLAAQRSENPLHSDSDLLEVESGEAFFPSSDPSSDSSVSSESESGSRPVLLEDATVVDTPLRKPKGMEHENQLSYSEDVVQLYLVGAGRG